ncbi:MAG: hypothetical protein ACLUD0_18735 [Eubacterium ramulus]
MKTDIEIAQEAVMEPIGKVAEKIGIERGRSGTVRKVQSKIK